MIDLQRPSSRIRSTLFTRDFRSFENGRDVSPAGHASPGDVVKWRGKWFLPYQSYPAQPARLCFAESADLNEWSAPKVLPALVIRSCLSVAPD